MRKARAVTPRSLSSTLNARQKPKGFLNATTAPANSRQAALVGCRLWRLLSPHRKRLPASRSCAHPRSTLGAPRKPVPRRSSSMSQGSRAGSVGMGSPCSAPAQLPVRWSRNTRRTRSVGVPRIRRTLSPVSNGRPVTIGGRPAWVANVKGVPFNNPFKPTHFAASCRFSCAA